MALLSPARAIFAANEPDAKTEVKDLIEASIESLSCIINFPPPVRENVTDGSSVRAINIAKRSCIIHRALLIAS